MQTTAATALWFLPFAGPIALWVAWSDMKTMLIPNKAVLALIAVFAVIGLLALPLDVWAMRWVHLLVVLGVGFVLNLTGMIGAGDAKFAAAMAPFVALADVGGFALLFSGVLIAALLVHRLARMSPALRRAAPGWESWERTEFPMGLALGAGLLFYLILAALRGV